MYRVRELPKIERPRERLLEVGASNLSNEELLAIILKNGTTSKNVKQLSGEVLKEFGGVYELKNVTVERLKKIKGIGDVKAIEVVAAIEFGKRIFLSKNDHNKKRMMNAKTILEETKYLFYDKKQENLYCLYFDNKQKLIGKKLMFIGTINRIIVHPREIFKEAYLLSASSIVCIHNHPSGDVTPSREDKEFTKNLVEIGKIQGIPVVDHIIVSEDEYYSFYDSFDKF